MKVSLDKSDQNNLWNDIRNGNADAFNQLYDQYADILFSFGLSITNDSEHIKDSIHDLFFELYKYRKNLSDTDNIKNYLFKSLKRKIYTGQKRKLKISYSREVQESDQLKKESIEDGIIRAEKNDAIFIKLTKAINKLPKRQREALNLKFSAELSYLEISEIMDISVESVRTLIYRSLKILRKNLSGNSRDTSIILFFLKMVSKKHQ